MLGRRLFRAGNVAPEWVVGHLGLGLFGLHMKAALTGQKLTISRNWLVQREGASPESARCQMSEHQKHLVNTML